MKHSKLLFLISSCFLLLASCYWYSETPEDATLRLSIQKNVDSRFQSGNYDAISGAIAKMNLLLTQNNISERLRYHLERANLYSKRMQKTVANSSTQLSPSEFLQTYYKYISSAMTEEDHRILQSCMDRYDAVDAVAKRENFPTALILATWRKESSCRVVNPGNGDGLFQIVAHHYEPSSVYQLKNLIWSWVYDQSGDLLGSGRLVSGQNFVFTWMFADPQRIPFVQSWNILEEQVMDFIDFARAKWKWYDNLDLYDEVPVQLSYDTIDLLSIRKHAILYNSIAKGRHPENSFYANQNFGWDYEKKQDGLVVMVLRVLENIYKK
jgi:hypothetical protein